MDSVDAQYRPEKRRANADVAESGSLPIRSSPQSKRFRMASDAKGGFTILDYLNFDYPVLQDVPGIQLQRGLSIGTLTQSATNLWSWRDIKRVDILDEVTSAAYLEAFHELFSLDIQDHPLAVPPSQLPDIDLYIRSEKQAEIFLQKTICVRVNTALQMIFDKLSSNKNLSLSREFPAIIQRPVYSPGLRSGSSSKNSAMIPDLWCHSFSDLMQKNTPFVVGDIKLDWKWNPFLGQSSDNDSLISYRTGLAQINFYMTVKNCMSALMLTEKGAVIVQRVPGWTGWVKVSAPFVGLRDMSIALIGLCVAECSINISHIQPTELRDASPDTSYPREESEPPSSSSKVNPSTGSYSPSIANQSSPLPPRTLRRNDQQPVNEIVIDEDTSSNDL